MPACGIFVSTSGRRATRHHLPVPARSTSRTRMARNCAAGTMPPHGNDLVGIEIQRPSAVRDGRLEQSGRATPVRRVRQRNPVRVRSGRSVARQRNRHAPACRMRCRRSGSPPRTDDISDSFPPGRRTRTRRRHLVAIVPTWPRRRRYDEHRMPPIPNPPPSSIRGVVAGLDPEQPFMIFVVPFLGDHARSGQPRQLVGRGSRRCRRFGSFAGIPDGGRRGGGRRRGRPACGRTGNRCRRHHRFGHDGIPPDPHCGGGRGSGRAERARTCARPRPPPGRPLCSPSRITPPGRTACRIGGSGPRRASCLARRRSPVPTSTRRPNGSSLRRRVRPGRPAGGRPRDRRNR